MKAFLQFTDGSFLFEVEQLLSTASCRTHTALSETHKEMDTPGNNFHCLSGKLQGYYSVKVNTIGV